MTHDAALQPQPGDRVLVAMSGGVDSSVAAALLGASGCAVVGVTMKLHGDGADVPDRPCCSLDATSDARRVCETLGIPHYVTNLVDHFGHDVLDDFVQEYARGRTPIPCVRCNTFTKFRDLLDKADAIDARWLATGHYARMGRVDDHAVMRRGLDPAKDQSYFLWGVDRSVLDRLVLPIGGQTKAETREIARRFGLRTAEKRESQDICFVPDGDHVRVIAEHLGADAPALQPGPLRLTNGEVVGEHQGFARYTIGQRKGLPGGFSEPMFVVEIVPSERAVVIGPREALLGRGLEARALNWLVARTPAVGATVQVQVRNRAKPSPATLVRLDQTGLELALDEPIQAIAPGQSLVVYDGDIVLGGGVIERGLHTSPTRRLPILAA
ncbi:MAG: tRNA 2-thiouridine(34) synthase MnmA [Gemmatimonas sp.]|uniref:tRNA 2-thiouridine(34) synthase MnmA n=1 Tax=Gemmatimonas sp. TaxID=1962908 RepID=UPI00391FA394